MNIKYLDDDVIIDNIRKGDEKALGFLYSQFREPFKKWALGKFPSFREEEIKDVFQDTVCITYLNIISGKLGSIKRSLSSYFHTIGKHKLYDLNKKKYKKDVSLEEFHSDLENIEEIDLNIIEKHTHKHQEIVVQMLLNEIGDPCKRIIELIFFHGYSNEPIAVELQYKNEQVISVKKIRCMQKLRSILKDKGITKDSLF